MDVHGFSLIFKDFRGYLSIFINFNWFSSMFIDLHRLGSWRGVVYWVPLATFLIYGCGLVLAVHNSCFGTIGKEPTERRRKRSSCTDVGINTYGLDKDRMRIAISQPARAQPLIIRGETKKKRKNNLRGPSGWWGIMTLYGVKCLCPKSWVAFWGSCGPQYP